MFIFLTGIVFIVTGLDVYPRTISNYDSMKNNSKAVYSNNYYRLREVVLQHNYGYFNKRELCESMAQVIMNDKSSDQLAYSRKHAAISLLLCHVDSSTSDMVIDMLIRNIQYRDPSAQAMMTRDQQYPCLACLLKIGRKVSKKILDYVADSDDQLNNTYLAQWFLIYYGQEDGIYIVNKFLEKYKPVLTEVQQSRIEKFVKIKLGGTVKN